MGYSAGKCGRFPAGDADAVRFAVVSDNEGAIHVRWVQERDHLPAAYGRIEYRRHTGAFLTVPDQEILTAQAHAYVASYLKRRRAPR
jgi:hypothetical protein